MGHIAFIAHVLLVPGREVTGMSVVLLERKVARRPSRRRQRFSSSVLRPLMAGSSGMVARGKRIKASRRKRGQWYLAAVSL